MIPSTPAARVRACPTCGAPPGGKCIDGVMAVDEVHEARPASARAPRLDDEARERIIFHAGRLLGIASRLRGPMRGGGLDDVPGDLDEIAAQILSAIGAGDLVPTGGA